MKIEVEITEAEIKSAIERKIRVAIADETTKYSADNYIKEQVKVLWKETADKLIVECLNDTPKLQAAIVAAITAKLKGRLTALMKESE